MTAGRKEDLKQATDKTMAETAKMQRIFFKIVTKVKITKMKGKTQ